MIDNPQNSACIPVSHYHCHYCKHVAPVDDLPSAYNHIRNCHPEVWNSDPELREEAKEYGVR